MEYDALDMESVDKSMKVFNKKEEVFLERVGWVQQYQL
jgi:hypothetical protein